MYRIEILGMHLPNTIAPKSTNDLTMSGSRLSNDSGYVDEMNAKNQRKNVKSALTPIKSLEDWKVSGTLDQLAHLKIDAPVDGKEKPDKIEVQQVELNNMGPKEDIKMEEAGGQEERPGALDDINMKQKEEALRLQRELFSSIANRNQTTDVISRTLKALEAEEPDQLEIVTTPQWNTTKEAEQQSNKEPELHITKIEEEHQAETADSQHGAETEKLDESAVIHEKEPSKCLLSPNLEKIGDVDWQLLNTPKKELETKKKEAPSLLNVEQISVIPPTPLKEDGKQKRLKDLDLKREHKDSISTDYSSLDTEAEQQKISELGSNNTTLAKSTLDKMHREIERLTLDQRELCRICFQKIEKHPIPFGLSIMIRLFSNHPQYKDIWPQFKQIPDSSLMHAPELRRHARIYMAGLRLIINSMNDDNKLETSLRGIAQAHVKWHIHKFHLINMLPCVIEAFQTKFSMSVDQVQAWTTLFDVIANLIDIFRSH